MFFLKDARGKTALMKDGTPFQYSSRALAELGAKWLGQHRRKRFRVLAS